jgi:hypothetical protein
MNNDKRSRYAERPNWWPRAVRCARVSELDSLGKCPRNMMLTLTNISKRSKKFSSICSTENTVLPHFENFITPGAP